MTSIYWLLGGSAAVAALLGSASWLVWPGHERSETRLAVGQALLVGAVVSVAFIPMQYGIQLGFRERDEQAADLARVQEERRELLSILASSADLRGIDLRDEDLRGLYLRGKNLTEANLQGADLRGANLDGARLTRADLSAVDMSGASARRVDLRGARVTGLRARAVDLTRADLSVASLSRVSTPLRSSRSLDFTDATMVRAHLQGAMLIHSGPGGVRLPARFVRADLSGARLDDAVLIGADLEGANLSGSSATGAFLCEANLEGSFLTHASFRDVDLIRADLRHAVILGFSSFSGADLRGADLRQTDTSEPTSYRFRDTHFNEGVGLPTDAFRDAMYDRHTRGSAAIARFDAQRSTKPVGGGCSWTRSWSRRRGNARSGEGQRSTIGLPP